MIIGSYHRSFIISKAVIEYFQQMSQAITKVIDKSTISIVKGPIFEKRVNCFFRKERLYWWKRVIKDASKSYKNSSFSMNKCVIDFNDSFNFQKFESFYSTHFSKQIFNLLLSYSASRKQLTPLFLQQLEMLFIIDELLLSSGRAYWRLISKMLVFFSQTIQLPSKSIAFSLYNIQVYFVTIFEHHS